MKRIVYIRGKFKGNNKEMNEAYLYAKEMMRKYRTTIYRSNRRRMEWKKIIDN